MFLKSLFPVFTTYSSFITKTIQSNVLLTNSGKLNIISPSIESVRYAARKGTRAAALAKKKARKLADANKPKPIPKHLQRKVKISSELERRRCTDENWLEIQPIDNVFDMKLYRGKPYQFSEVVEMYRQSHQPAMLDDASAILYADVELDLKLKKKDKYLESMTGLITYPNMFDSGKKNKVIVVCKTPEDQQAATDAGAIQAGSTALIKQILAGTIYKDDFDYLICHPDMYKELSTLRGILSRKFPNTANGLLRIDIEPAVKSFISGIEYGLKRSVLEPDFGFVNFAFGRLNMPYNELEENLKHALNAIEKHKPQFVEHMFIVRTRLYCEKSRELFKIAHWDYLEGYPTNGVLTNDDEEDREISVEKKIAS